ncbi:type I-C CRISPR-associated protein Cas8c/Csd1 [Actinokineospora sp. UTMC 2448]|uniref:type I-C CRISPR-associated protein Cas8c/Csd1 n=1 Tax=Actinokineospora sp. UTMC 2448 TaxID=2268449 RepID=UPI002164D82C|nr:type I-C CRISPR-associated protein Cas8c/Csd1 [Actinokineospora sp. UTMC 2448]UVS80617.1 CRISPR-associated protein Cas8c/Csd1, subtype I-C/DVULG [Actinokineospora sp. UTMC 2448]
MLLQRLAEHARQDPEGKPFHRKLAFRWELRLDADGTPMSTELESLVESDEKGRSRPAEHTVPAAVRAFGVAANLAADDVQYVLGWSDEESKPERVDQCHKAFVDLTRRWHDEHPDDPAARALAAFYRQNGPELIQQTEGVASKDRVLVTVAGDAAYRSPSAPDFWAREVGRRKGGTSSGLCLVCGQIGPLLDTIPSKVPARWVPGASNDAALVSVNERVFGYGLTTKLVCSPICVGCGEAASNGLVRVLTSDQAVNYGGQDSRLAWWLTEPAAFDPMNLVFEGDPSKIEKYVEAARRGDRAGFHQLRGTTDLTRFCALSVGGNVARIMVRDWIDMPLHALDANIIAWFDDQRIAPLWATDSPWQSLPRLVLVTGRWLRQEKRYAFLGAKAADRPEAVQRDLLRALLRKTPLPPALLAHMVNRVRTDGHLDTARSSLIRLLLTRFPLSAEKPMPSLDTTNRDSSYVAGRIFATLESLQYSALGGKLNTTYGDRYFAGAISNPRAALVNGRKDANAWLRKLRRINRGAAVKLDKALDELFNLLTVAGGIPARTSIAQQATFLLGYHHQRAHTFAEIRSSTPDPSTGNASEDPTA